MSMPATQNKIDLSAWQVESFRVTCFPSSTTKFSAENWWQDTIGEQPENTTVRVRDGFRQDDGHFNGRKVVLGVQPIRIDWLMVPNEEEGQVTIGSFEDSLASFLEMMARWFKISPALRRLALGTILALPVESRQTGYELLGNYLPNVKLDPIGTSDFLYQINRPRNSQVQISELQINRLTKWSVLQRGLVGFELSPNAPVATLVPSSETFACRLELDINTSADYKNDLPSDKLTAVFNELVDLTKEIALKGDIP
jgi:hypothetical protein